MPTGFQTFVPGTSIIRLDITDRYARVLGRVSVPTYTQPALEPGSSTSAGSQANSLLSLGDPFWVIVPRLSFVSGSLDGQYYQQAPDVWVSGTTLYWTYANRFLAYTDDVTQARYGGVDIVYGVM